MLPMLQLAGEVHWADQVEIEVGASRWTLSEGYVFEVADGDGAPAGFVFVGEGTAGVAIADHGEAVALAAGLALGPDGDDLARRAASEHRWSGRFDTALVLGADPEPARVVDALPTVTDVEHGNVYVDAPPERYDVFVTGLRLGPARARAAAVLERRLQRLAAAGVDPRAAIALDAHEPPERHRWVAEIHADQRWLPLLEPASATTQDEWLSFGHDPERAIDDRYTDTVFLHGSHDRADADPVRRFRVLTGTPGAPLARGARITEAAVNVTAAPVGTQTTHGVVFEARLSVVSDVPTRLVSLALPSEREENATEGRIVTGARTRIEAVEVDGVALPSVGAVFGPWDPPGEWLTDTWLLPEPLEPGVPAVLSVRWTDRWPASHLLLAREWARAALDRAGVCGIAPGADGVVDTCGCLVAGMPESIDLGTVAEARAVVPRAFVGPDRFPAEVRVAVPAKGWSVAVDGAKRTLPAGDGLVTVAETTGAARVSLARGGADVASAAGPFPEIRILEQGLSDGDHASLVRAILNFYRPALPPFPHAALSVVEGVQAPQISKATMSTLEQKGCKVELTRLSQLQVHRPLVSEVPGRAPEVRDLPWVGAVPGQVVYSGLLELGSEVGGVTASIRKRYPHLVERGMAEALAQQWFDGVALAPRDAWIAPSVAAWLRDRFVTEAYGEEVAADWDRTTRTDLDAFLGNAPLAPLTGASHPWRGEVGAAVLRALSARVGEQAVLRGIDAFLRSDDPTTAGLERALSQAAGIDLAPLFDAFVEAGVRPAITGTWEVQGRDVVVSLASDFAAAPLDIPVGITTRSGTRLSWIRLTDGRGTVRISAHGTPLRVQIDPDSVIPLASASVTRTGETRPPEERSERADRRYTSR